MRKHFKLSTEAFATRLSIYYAAACLVFGVQTPFFPVWLSANGLDPRSIGFVLAIPMLVRLVSVPLIAREADRRNAGRAALIAASFLCVTFYSLLAFAHSETAIVLGYILASMAFTVMMPLTEAYALHGLRARGRAYGPVRLWGSVSFVAATLCAGYIADIIAPQDLIWVIVGTLAINAAGSLLLTPVAPHPPTDESFRATRLLRNPAFVTVVAAAALVQASHATFYGFSTLDWKASGFGGLTIGVLWSIGVIVEIGLFAYSGRLPPFFGPANLLAIGALAGVLRWSVMAFSPPLWVLPFVQALHALTYAATHLGTMGLVIRIAPARLGATAQSYVALVLGLVQAGVTMLAGALYESYGASSYAAMALIALGGAVIALSARGLWRAHGGA